jgi:hypothetical protein
LVAACAILHGGETIGTAQQAGSLADLLVETPPTPFTPRDDLDIWYVIEHTAFLGVADEPQHPQLVAAAALASALFNRDTLAAGLITTRMRQELGSMTSRARPIGW